MTCLTDSKEDEQKNITFDKPNVHFQFTIVHKQYQLNFNYYLLLLLLKIYTINNNNIYCINIY